MTRLTTSINLPSDPKQLAQRVTELLREANAQINGLTEGNLYAVHSARTAAPTTGTWAQGDYIRNSTPSGGSPTIGWICTASGTPGTWVAVAVGGGGGVSDGDKGDITVSGSGATWTIDNDSVTFAKFQNITDDRLLGRSAGSSGDMQEITVGVGLDLSSGSLVGSLLEARTSDPGSPVTGQMWLRTDL